MRVYTFFIKLIHRLLGNLHISLTNIGFYLTYVYSFFSRAQDLFKVIYVFGLKKSIVKFLTILIKYLIKYFLFILPFILIFKGLYICWSDGVITVDYFSQQFISNIPFLGENLSNSIWGNNLILSFENIKDNQKITQLIFIGGLGSCLGKTIFETWFSDCDYFKLPAVAGPGALRDGEGIKIPLILQSTQGDSDLNLASSNVPVQGTAVPPQGTSPVEGSSRPVKGSVEDMSSSGFWKTPLNTFKQEISPCFKQHTEV